MHISSSFAPGSKINTSLHHLPQRQLDCFSSLHQDSLSEIAKYLDPRSFTAFRSTSVGSIKAIYKAEWPVGLPFTRENVEKLPPDIVQLGLLHAEANGIDDFLSNLNLICERYGRQLTSFALSIPPVPGTLPILKRICAFPNLTHLGLEFEVLLDKAEEWQDISFESRESLELLVEKSAALTGLKLKLYLPHLLQKEFWYILRSVQHLQSLSVKSGRVFVEFPASTAPPFVGGSWEDIDAIYDEGRLDLHQAFFPTLYSQLEAALIPILARNRETLEALGIENALRLNETFCERIMENVDAKHFRRLHVDLAQTSSAAFHKLVHALPNLEELHVPLLLSADELEVLKELPRLRILGLNTLDIPHPQVLEDIFHASPNLTYLKLENCTGEGIDSTNLWSALRHALNLQTLVIDSCPALANSVLNPVTNEPGLLRLREDIFIPLLMSGNVLPKLSYLALKGYDDIPSRAIAFLSLLIAQRQMPALRELWLGQFNGAIRELAGKNPADLQMELQSLLNDRRQKRLLFSAELAEVEGGAQVQSLNLSREVKRNYAARITERGSSDLEAHVPDRRQSSPAQAGRKSFAAFTSFKRV